VCVCCCFLLYCFSAFVCGLIILECSIMYLLSPYYACNLCLTCLFISIGAKVKNCMYANVVDCQYYYYYVVCMNLQVTKLVKLLINACVCVCVCV